MSDVPLSSDDEPVENTPPTNPESQTNNVDKPETVPEDAKDNISISTDWETESEEVPTSEPPKEKQVDEKPKKQTPKQKSASRVHKNEDSDVVSSESVSYINDKGRPKKATEIAFKKLDLAANDPNLKQHMDDRRKLAKRLEEDPVFRDKYIKEQERLRLEAEENESCADSAEINNALKHISKLQGKDTDEPTESENSDKLDHLDGISDDGSVQGSYFESQDYSYSDRKHKKRDKRDKGRSGIYIKKLVVKNLVLNF